MPKSKVVEEVAESFKKLKPSQKNYVLGVMQGFLLARNPISSSNSAKSEKINIIRN